MVLDFLIQERVLIVQGTAFNLRTPDHIRMVFLPRIDDLGHAIGAFENFLRHYEQ
jgi:alanine-synthesizing transaminase